jgi:PIN domain nuclease of toxin-antitoxin system
VIRHLDTQVALWVFQRRRSRLSADAVRALENGTILLSPVVLFELEILFEIGKSTDPADVVFAELAVTIDAAISDRPFAEVVEAARSFAWTRDPFDRLIVAAAIADGAALITADRQVLDNFPAAVW